MLSAAETKASSADEIAEKLEKDANGLQLQIAQADERAAQANRTAESERLARVGLEQQLSWRSLTSDQATAIAGKLMPFAGQQFDFTTFGSDGECLNFENELYRVVLAGHWLLDPNRKWSVQFTLVIGIEVRVSEKADTSTKDAATTLVEALNAEGISTTLRPIPAQEVPNPAVITITVGKSPNSMRPIIP